MSGGDGTAVRCPGTAVEAEIDLERDGFMRSLIAELTSLLDEVVGEEQVAGFVSTVGQTIAERILAQYLAAFGDERLSEERLLDVLLDLKRRIDGDFYIVNRTRRGVTFGCRRCPFGERVIGRPSLCMMTSNVFGTIAAESLGYAKVTLDRTIAKGAPECRVSLRLAIDADDNGPGREYFGRRSG